MKGGEYLGGSQSFWSLVDVHPSQTDSNCSRGDDDDTMALATEVTRRLDDERKRRQQRLVRVFIADRTRPWPSEPVPNQSALVPSLITMVLECLCFIVV
jgi:hypothetical protein